MDKDFLLEIGTEEIPSSFLPQALEDLRRLALDLLASTRLSSRAVRTMGTPRRLALFIDGLGEEQGDLVQEVTGPPRSVAFAPDGTPTKALEKFCDRYGARPEDLTFVQKEKGEYVSLKRVEKGRKTAEVLRERLPGLILSIPFPKVMRWAAAEIRFARPIHWILALYESQPLRIQVGEILSSDCTIGHRFLGSQKPLPVTRVGDYLEVLESNGVVLDPQERRTRILVEARRLAAEVGGILLEDDTLLQTLVFLTEHPVAIRGGFDPGFLDLPEEVLIAPMKGHQRYFPVHRQDGNGLLPYFIAVANNRPDDTSRIEKGMERVLKARLEDARFFFKEDTRKPLDQNLDRLRQVIFHKKLGTSHDKVQRIGALSRFLGERICPENLPQLLRAAALCKVDLVTQMVGEFPELQGIMGGIYAAHGGESSSVVQAIREHYLPVAAEGALPRSTLGAIVSLADKMDTIVGFFGVGNPVTGNADPFQLRRRSIGVLRILLDQDIEVSLSQFVSRSEDILGQLVRKDQHVVLAEVLDFFRQRYQPLLLAKGYPYDTIEAVFAKKLDHVPDICRRIAALHEMRTRDADFEKLIIGCKRAVNILQQAEKEFGYLDAGGPPVDEGVREGLEKELCAALLRVEGSVLRGMESRDYQSVLRALVDLKTPIDRFFEGTMVLVADAQTREARLQLLSRIARLFQQFADFSKIVF